MAEIRNYGLGRFAFTASEEHLTARAARVGCQVVLPRSNQLFLDLDTDEQFEQFQNRINFFIQNEYEITVKTTRSRNGNRHVIVTLPFDMTNEQRVILQAALGSDWKREAISAMRSICKADVVSCFFEKVKQPEDHMSASSSKGVNRKIAWIVAILALPALIFRSSRRMAR